MRTSGSGTKIKKHTIINSQVGRNKGKINKTASHAVLSRPGRVTKVK